LMSCFSVDYVLTTLLVEKKQRCTLSGQWKAQPYGESVAGK
jgi:hypothetical protein